MSTLELEHLKHTSSSSNNLSVHSDGTVVSNNKLGIGTVPNATFGSLLYAQGTPAANKPIISGYSQGNSNNAGLALFNDTGNRGIWTGPGSSMRFTRSYEGNSTVDMNIDTSGHVTTPNQPICTLQPDASSNVTTANSTDHIVGWKTGAGGRQTLLRSGLTLSAASGTTIANGGSTGRITFSTGGVYYFDCTIRMENTPGAGNLKLHHNGNAIHRMHVETWGRYNYAHAWISRCITASANDYVEFVVAVPSGTFSGSNDTVNWLTIIKVA
jgi:hypothetical protein